MVVVTQCDWLRRLLAEAQHLADAEGRREEGAGAGGGGVSPIACLLVMRTHHSWTVVFPPPVLFKLRGCSCSIRRLPLRLPPIRMIS